MLKTSRGVIKYFLLTIITLGIYPLVFIQKMASETNTTCEPDEKKTAGVVPFILLTIITLGIYAIVWNYKVCERHCDFLHNHNSREILSGGGWIMWDLLGIFIGIGPIIGLYKQIQQWNKVNEIYNQNEKKIEKQAV